MLEGPFGPATQLLAEIRYELERLNTVVFENAERQTEAPHIEVLPAPIVLEDRPTPVIDLSPLREAFDRLSRPTPGFDPTPALIGLLAEIQGMRNDFQESIAFQRDREQAKGMFGIGASSVSVTNTVPVKNDPDGAPLNVTIVSGQTGGGGVTQVNNASEIATDVGYGATDTSMPVAIQGTPTVDVGNFPSTQPVSGTVAVSNLPVTQPVSGTVAVSAVAGNVDVTPSAPVAGDYLPVRLTDGAAFYSAGGGVTEVNDSSGVATTVGYRSSDLPMPVKTQSLGTTWVASATAVSFAANKYHLAIFNGAGSGKTIKVRKVFAVDEALSSVTGVAVQFNFEKSTAQSAGTAITPVPMDSASAALPAQVAVATGATVTDGAFLWPFTTTNDEVGATNAFPSTQIQQFGNIMMEGDEIQELTLHEGEGFAVKQITSTTVGTFGWIAVFTVE